MRSRTKKVSIDPIMKPKYFSPDISKKHCLTYFDERIPDLVSKSESENIWSTFLAKQRSKSREFLVHWENPYIVTVLFFARKWTKCFKIWILRPDLESFHPNTSYPAIFKFLSKRFIFYFKMEVNWELFRLGPDGGRVKWKTTDVILFPHGRGMIKSHGHHALKKMSWATHPTPYPSTYCG